MMMMTLTVANILAYLLLLVLNTGASVSGSADDLFHGQYLDHMMTVSNEDVVLIDTDTPNATNLVGVEAKDPITQQDLVRMENLTEISDADPEFLHKLKYELGLFYEAFREQCLNEDAVCAHWAAIGECYYNPAYMQLECAGACPLPPLLNEDDADSNSLDVNYGVPQKVVHAYEDAIRTLADQMVQYMENVVFQDNYSFPEIRDQCQNRDEHCLYWAATGQLDAYTKIDCAPASLACEHLSFEYRCRDFRHPVGVEHNNNSSDNDTIVLSTQDNAWKPGDLNAMFERIVSTTSMYNSTILLRPNDDGDVAATSTDLSKSDDGSDQEQEQPVQRQPWIVIIDDFLTGEECERLIELGGKRGYEISVDYGEMKFDGTYDEKRHEGRTSTNAWCVTDDCYKDPVTQKVLARMENLTGIPDVNAEYLQLLKYEVGQFYEAHHDYVDHEVARAQGVRVLTVFLYLNDVVAGGGTHFTELNLTVMPKQGRALLWPSVYNESPDIQDPITEHEALPVVEGVKYGANAWFHQRDFKTPFRYNCV